VLVEWLLVLIVLFASSLVAVLGLIIVHLYASNLAFLQQTPRSIWLSIAGGISVAYVFIHILPELSDWQESIKAAAGEAAAFLEYHAYLIALASLTLYYGIQKLALASRHQQRARGEPEEPSAAVFWLHIASFAIYNGLIGYLLLHRAVGGLRSLTVFAFAMGVHFLVTDHGLREQFQRRYLNLGRYLLSFAVVAGWLIGIWVDVPDPFLSVLFAFLAGGVVLNVLKEELPEERESRFWAFLLGAVLYSLVLIAL